MFMAGLKAHYSARDIEARILAAVRAAGLSPEQRLWSEALGSPDHFHTGGFRASLELLELAQIGAEVLRGDLSGPQVGRSVRLPGYGRWGSGCLLFSPSLGHRHCRQLPCFCRRAALGSRREWLHC
ncbi:hypothetical protein ACCAA_560014 [Candidatus Accumulibacter aalborgensis]|uniref:Uncharacterized protein n=1 Tax=Candidatus Accumulibacter aalborgensis TaxID=1860102 RepID=A0A1A8XTC0_9PROT|nr:hypothetical protein ACCAA_560014 [Candidatus Accumulibacter aalborgensis]